MDMDKVGQKYIAAYLNKFDSTVGETEARKKEARRFARNAVPELLPEFWSTSMGGVLKGRLRIELSKRGALRKRKSSVRSFASVEASSVVSPVAAPTVSPEKPAPVLATSPIKKLRGQAFQLILDWISASDTLPSVAVMAHFSGFTTEKLYNAVNSLRRRAWGIEVVDGGGYVVTARPAPEPVAVVAPMPSVPVQVALPAPVAINLDEIEARLTHKLDARFDALLDLLKSKH